jgi:hypothetical protein
MLAAFLEIRCVFELFFVQPELQVLAVTVEEIEEQHHKEQKNHACNEQLLVKSYLFFLLYEGVSLAFFFDSDVGLGFGGSDFGIGIVGAAGLFELEGFDLLVLFRLEMGEGLCPSGFELFEPFGFAGFDLSEAGFGIGLGFEEADLFIGRAGSGRGGVRCVAGSRQVVTLHECGTLGFLGSVAAIQGDQRQNDKKILFHGQDSFSCYSIIKKYIKQFPMKPMDAMMVRSHEFLFLCLSTEVPFRA